MTEAIKTIFGGVWELFLSVDVPGLDVSFAAFLVAVFLMRFSIRLFGFLSGFGMSGGDYGRAATAAEKYRNDRQKAMDDDLPKLDW